MRGYFQEKLDKEFDYFDLKNGTADVFIYKYIGETSKCYENHEYVEYEYEINEFRCNVEDIKYSDVSSDPMKYLNYQNHVQTNTTTIDERIESLEKDTVEALTELGDITSDMGVTLDDVANALIELAEILG